MFYSFQSDFAQVNSTLTEFHGNRKNAKELNVGIL